MPRKKLVHVDIDGYEFKLTRDEAKALIGRMAQQMRDVYGRSTGRPMIQDRCPCGIMSAARAEKRGHKCEGDTPRRDAMSDTGVSPRR